MSKTHVIIVGGGVGQRMQSKQPKQFLPVKDKSILQHTLEAFHAFDPTYSYTVVLPHENIDFWKNHVGIKKINISHHVISGGEERFHSVKNALNSIALSSNDDVVMVHDAVRPFVSKQTLKNCWNGLKEKGNAVPAIEVNDSIRVITAMGSESINRAMVRRIQTPQCFRLADLKKAYDQPYNPKFTDDASVAESIGIKINLVEGNPENIKITTPFDLKLAEIFAK